MPPSSRSTVQRLAENARYDRETVEAILDAGLVAHVGIVHDGAPVVTPMAYARIARHVYLHGSGASRLMRVLHAGAEVCVAVTIVDGVLLARSAFNMSMSYRSVVVLGRAEPVVDPEARTDAFVAIMDHLVPGHWAHVRPPNDRELRATLVVAVALDEASAKVGEGPPTDDHDDDALPHWAGEIPFRTVALAPRPAPRLGDGVVPPPTVRDYRRLAGTSPPSH